jgi:hypothetical protein
MWYHHPHRRRHRHCRPSTRYPVITSGHEEYELLEHAKRTLAHFPSASASYLENKKEGAVGGLSIAVPPSRLVALFRRTNRPVALCQLYQWPATVLKQPTIVIIFRNVSARCAKEYDRYMIQQRPTRHQYSSYNMATAAAAMEGFALVSAQKCLAEWSAASDDQKNARLKLTALVDEGNSSRIAQMKVSTLGGPAGLTDAARKVTTTISLRGRDERKADELFRQAAVHVVDAGSSAQSCLVGAHKPILWVVGRQQRRRSIVSTAIPARVDTERRLVFVVPLGKLPLVHALSRRVVYSTAKKCKWVIGSWPSTIEM